MGSYLRDMATAPALQVYRNGEDPTSGRGIIFGVLFSLPLWAVLVGMGVLIRLAS
jgi:hypothetical protein